ncbi:hypothetical protein DFH06DRAFT_1330035 [Mycena polygramma]|nr:hypothetical protein DFH06DRAFT_1330035 [Mycena polygramma]
MSSPSSEPAPDETDRDGVESVLRSYLYHDLLQKHLSPPKELGIPSKQLWPEDWNFHFERACLRKYGPNADLATWKRENYDFELISYIGNLRRCNQDIAATSKALLESEGVLVALAIEELVDRDFEAAWMALEKGTNLEEGTKQCLVLEGLVHAAFKAREKSRFDCPEMSLFGLIGDGEYNLINLLKAIVAHDPTGNLRVKSLYLFSHPAVEREYSRYTNPGTPDDLRAFGHLRMVQRSLYIVQALICILEAYAGKPAPKISIKEEQEANQRLACFSCRATTADGITLRMCSACKLVSYCSSECQTRDWREHKRLCRTRPTRFDPALVTPKPEAPPQFIGCPAPKEGYVRSPALWRQIMYLSKPDSYGRDYHFDTTPGCTRSIRIQEPGMRVVFLVARRRAFASGDPVAVRKMFNLLRGQQRAGFVNLTVAQIRGQFEREFRLTLGPSEGMLPVTTFSTTQEVNEEIGFAMQRDGLAEVRARQEDEQVVEVGAGASANEEKEYDHAAVMEGWDEQNIEDDDEESGR